MINISAGDRLCISDDNNLTGTGTYVYRNYIYAAIGGIVQVKSDSEHDPNEDNHTSSHKHRTISVIHNVKVGINRVPSTGVIVTCKVLSINSLMVKCQICCIEDHILKLPFRATLRKEEIASDNKDIVEVHKCFRPRDVILARVIGLSDQGYMLTTAEDELGVVTGYSEAGMFLIRFSIQMMYTFFLHQLLFQFQSIL